MTAGCQGTEHCFMADDDLYEVRRGTGEAADPALRLYYIFALGFCSGLVGFIRVPDSGRRTIQTYGRHELESITRRRILRALDRYEAA